MCFILPIQLGRSFRLVLHCLYIGARFAAVIYFCNQAPVALKTYICNINQLSNRYKLQHTVGSRRSALCTENSLLIAELVQCGRNATFTSCLLIKNTQLSLLLYTLVYQRSELPVRELVPKGDPVFLYQDLEGKKIKISCKILLNRTPTVLTPQVINILYFKSELNKLQQ